MLKTPKGSYRCLRYGNSITSTVADQGFRRGDAPTPDEGAPNIIWQNFYQKNCMKMREIGPSSPTGQHVFSFLEPSFVS